MKIENLYILNPYRISILIVQIVVDGSIEQSTLIAVN